MLVKKFNNERVFSIIIPVYNCEKYIADCLNSCLAQDIPPIEYEIICVDDGSTDMSAQILEEYRAKYKNINVLHQSNQGVSVARNKGIEIAKGEYVWFVDADDLIQENVLSKLKNIIECSPKDCFFLKAYFFWNSLSDEETKLKKQGLLNPAPELKTEYCTLKLFKKEIIIENNVRFAQGIVFGEDQLFNFEFFKYAKSDTVLDITTYFYRFNNNSVMRAGDESERRKKWVTSLIDTCLFLIAEQNKEEKPNKEKTICYLFNRRAMLLERVATFSLRNALSELKRIRRAGLFDLNYLVPRNLKIKRSQRCPRILFLKKRFKYVCNEKILTRISHPLRTVKNLFKRLFSKK